MTIRFDGADLAHYQATIDWPTLRAASWWVATKATQGVNYTDPTFTAHWAEMGVGFTHRLAYHWLSPNLDARAQAAHFLAVWDRTGGAMLDAEEGGITAAGVLAWCEAVEAVTHRPCSVYAGAYVAGGTIWQSTAVRTSKYGPRPMHLAAYTTEAKALALPGVKAYPWSAWQYSSNGPVPGVAGRCDMNRVDNREHYDLACGYTSTPSTPPPQPEADMAILTNSEPHPFTDGNTYQPGVVKWVAAIDKRHLQEEEWRAVYGGVAGIALSNLALASIPDYTPPTQGGASPTTFTLSLTGTGKAS